MRVPVATYRLQFNAGFRFEDARALLPYLDALGITDVYASPLLQARTGSGHGYDVTDPRSLNREIGTPRQFDRLAAALKARGMGLLLDIVPNHMAMSSENPWWMDVLENGPGSKYASFFDVDWDAPTLPGKIQLPILGAPYGEVLDRGELSLALGPGGLAVRYFEHTLPLDPGTWGPFLRHGLEHSVEAVGGSHPTGRRLKALIRTVEGMPDRRSSGPAARDRRARAAVSAKRRLWALYRSDPEARRLLEASLRAFGTRRRRPGSDGGTGEEALDLLDGLIGRQAYVLANWRAAPEEVDYRRFFDIADLVAVRTEDPEVFRATHDLALRLHGEGKITGFRIDHVDGLHDPLGYLRRLRAHSGGAYVVVEKILEGEESLPGAWPVAGTTGYDSLPLLGDVFVDPRGAEKLAVWWSSVTGVDRPFGELVVELKRAVTDVLFRSEATTLALRLQRLAREDRHGRDLTLSELHTALVEVTAGLPVYRTHTRSLDVGRRDRGYIEAAARVARHGSRPVPGAALDFLERVLLMDLPAGRTVEAIRAWLDFVTRWQQFSGSVMAKGFEDTLFYVYTPLASRNEVGANPGRPVVSVDLFHHRIRARRRSWPHAMNATSTHDTKRSEDVRARISVLSELPDAWAERVERWRAWNRPHLRDAAGEAAPDPGEEILLYQTLIGIWPAGAGSRAEVAGRVRRYMRKALREAKVHTNWIDPNAGYEEAVDGFVAAILDRSNRRFLRDLSGFAGTVAWYGALNSLAQAVLKIALPGVPDLYQGTELWDLTLVDPDNRRPVDFGLRRRLLRDLDRHDRRNRPELIRDVLDSWQDGRVKLFATSRALRFRRANPALFLDGSYAALRALGKSRVDNVCGLARRDGGAWAIALVPRLTTGLAGEGRPPLGTAAWGRSAVTLPAASPARWVDVFTGSEIEARPRGRARALRLAEVFGSFPVALLAGGTAEMPAR